MLPAALKKEQALRRDVYDPVMVFLVGMIIGLCLLMAITVMLDKKCPTATCPACPTATCPSCPTPVVTATPVPKELERFRSSFGYLALLLFSFARVHSMCLQPNVLGEHARHRE